jgi:hypothetical protein
MNEFWFWTVSASPGAMHENSLPMVSVEAKEFP